jgi:cellulose synthase/poly-beta-1,6-N-acetylglucosamine synthase-like glycosyltransferase
MTFLRPIPYVTIQLPIYNEKYSGKLTTIAEMDYPKHLLEIQVLDDSTDDSVVETEALIHKIAQVGLDIKTH